MRKLSFLRRAVVAGALLPVSAMAVSAQVVTYSTTGTFSGGSGTTLCTPTQCTAGGFTLTFANAPSTGYIAPTLVDLGQFVTSFSPTDGTSPLTAFAGVNFTLMITQTTPSSGSNTFADGISGQLAYNPSTSTLVWSPTVTALTIGSTTYRLVVDNSNNINIQAPTTGGGNPNPTSVKANVSVTPEPATLLLLAPGLVGLGLAARIRRRRTAA
jgi:MYXO-CTERM domain-containing protein